MEQSPKSPKSQKSPKLKESTATYVIAAHGTMLTSILGTPQTKKYFAINIPENVELYTHDTLGKCIPMYKTESDFVCKNYKDELEQSLSPAFKFSHEDGEINKFPELFFTPDSNTPAHFYTGITHCIPEALRTTGSRKKEIIYNIDAKNTKNCACSSIVSNSFYLPYDCEKKYSPYYKEQLRDYNYDPNSNISKCGPILLSEAVKVIKAHCNKYYEPNCVIKIYIFSCLVERDLEKLIYDYKRSYNHAKQLANPDNPESTSIRLVTPITTLPSTSVRLVTSDTILPQNVKQINPEEVRVSTNTNISKEQMIARLNDLTSRPRTLPKTLRELLTETPTFEPPTETPTFETPTTYLQSKANLRDFYYEVSEPKNNALSKVVLTNYVENLSDFKALPLIQSHLSKHRFSIDFKVFEFITYKDAYMEYTKEQDAKIDAPRHKRLEQLQKKHRALSRQYLSFYLINALNKIRAERGVDITILPEFNTISFVRPFTKSVTDNELVDSDLIIRVYDELKKLIALEKAKKALKKLIALEKAKKAKNTGLGLRKTLRNKGKKGKKDKKLKSKKAKKP
jgi:hypothetical protein